MPRSPGLIWILTGLLLLGFPAVSLIYWPEVLRSGALPPNGDSVAIPMFGSIIVTLALSPFIIGITQLGLKRYNPETRLASWRHDRLYRSILVTVVCGGMAIVIGALTVEGLETALHWYDYLWPAYYALCLLWLLAYRAAVIDQPDSEPSGA